MPGALPDWYPQYGFRAHRNRGSKGKRPQLVIGPQQHGNGKTRDVSRQQEIHQVTHPPGKGKWTPVGSSVNQFEQKLHAVGGRQSYQRLCPGLLEAQVDMANDIENRDSCGKAPQCCQAGRFTAILRGHHSTLLPLTTKAHTATWRNGFQPSFALLTYQPSSTVCQPGARETLCW